MFGGFRPRAVEVLNIDGFSRDHPGNTGIFAASFQATAVCPRPAWPFAHERVEHSRRIAAFFYQFRPR